jgi:hypothetical protein
LRLAVGLGLLAYILALFLAAYYDEIGISLGLMWLITLAVPAAVVLGVYTWARATRPTGAAALDPTAEDVPPSLGSHEHAAHPLPE